MESNTFVTSAYIDAPHGEVLEYLRDLRNLNDWTLSSRMKEQVDAHTWRGTASGYHHDLYYHLKRIEGAAIQGVEWHCGYRYGQYHQVYPVLLFRPEALRPGDDEGGTYLQWISFFDPKKSTRMIREGVGVVHTSECRSLKARLERRAGHDGPRFGRLAPSSVTIWVDAPYDDVVAAVGDVRTMGEWSHLLRPAGEGRADRAAFVDEYGRRLEARHDVTRLERWALIEQELRYDGGGAVERSPFLVMPCSYALGDADARGCFVHRVTFWPQSGRRTHGRLSDEDFGAELINLKRRLEAAAGNHESFARGLSYGG